MQNSTTTLIDPVEVPRKSWRPDDMTREDQAAMRAAADEVVRAWLVLHTALRAACEAQSRHQGNLSTGCYSQRMSAWGAVSSFIGWLEVRDGGATGLPSLAACDALTPVVSGTAASGPCNLVR